MWLFPRKFSAVRDTAKVAPGTMASEGTSTRNVPAPPLAVFAAARIWVRLATEWSEAATALHVYLRNPHARTTHQARAKATNHCAQRLVKGESSLY